MQKKSSYLMLLWFLLACFAISGLGGWITSTSVGTWYQTLDKPPFNPPDWIFGPVWSAIYICIAVAGWRVWRVQGYEGRSRTALSFFWLQLALNLLWSFLFFGLHWLGIAFLELCLLIGAVANTARLFFKLDRIAAYLFVPYLAWISFAAILNASIWMLNSQ